MRNALLAAAAVGLLVAIALAVALSNTLLRRLGRLRTAALRISEEGPDAPQLLDEGRDEVGDLARAFDRMQQELRRQEAARRSFVATASHELRTPLTMLQGTMELLAEDLRDGAVDLADAQLQVERARRELRRLSSLAGELLDLSRLDASVPLRSEAVELGELARAVAAEFALRGRRPRRRAARCPAPAARAGAAATRTRSPASCASCSTTRCATARRASRCGSRPAARAPTRASRSPTAGRASTPPTASRSSSASSAGAPRARRAASGSGWRSAASSPQRMDGTLELAGVGRRRAPASCSSCRPPSPARRTSRAPASARRALSSLSSTVACHWLFLSSGNDGRTATAVKRGSLETYWRHSAERTRTSSVHGADPARPCR